ncbi:MAG: DUF992 domain-containing protein [Hyphomicrobiaceae bacterium]|nr:DUF992 domain-containing protein [Hyphomicrobiaceae bacterium]
MMRSSILRAALALVSFAACGLLPQGSATAQKTEAMVNIGTLMCTVDPEKTPSPEPGALHLSCSYEPLTGPKAQFTGVVKKVTGDGGTPGKVVLAWSVMASSQSTPVERLEGSYLGTLDPQRGTRAPSLVGGAESSIALRPLTDTASLGDSSALAVLELQLASVRT